MSSKTLVTRNNITVLLVLYTTYYILHTTYYTPLKQAVTAE